MRAGFGAGGLLMNKLTKNLLALAVASVFSFSAAAASACDGMKDPASDNGDTQAKSDSGKTAKTKSKNGATKSRSDDSANKS
jgi:hypothetical protein